MVKTFINSLDSFANKFAQRTRNLCLSFDDEVAQVIAHMLSKHYSKSVEELTAEVKQWIDGEKPAALEQVVAAEIALHLDAHKNCHYQITCYFISEDDHNVIRIQYPEQPVEMFRLELAMRTELEKDQQCLISL